MHIPRKTFFFILVMMGFLGFTAGVVSAKPTNSFTVTMTSLTLDVTMGDPAGTNLVYSITNNNSSVGNLTQLQFTAPAGFTWQGCGSLPSSWTCGTGGGNSITIKAGTALTPGSTLSSVTLILGSIPSLPGDNSAATLASVKATFSKAPKAVTNTAPASTFPRVHALLMTLVPSPTSVTLGATFTLTMTVTNKSNVIQNTIVSSPVSPTKSGTGNATTTPGPTPASLSLAQGATGTMTWIYTATSAGTLTLAATATNIPSGGTATSIKVTSVVVTIANFIANITATPNCLYSGGTATFTMIVSNATGAAVNTVRASALTRNVTGAAVIGVFTALTPSTIPAIANGATGTFIWTAPVTGNVQDSYAVTGYATSSSPTNTTPTVTSNTQSISGYIAVVDPPSTNAGSTMQNLAWSIINYGCSTVTNNPTKINQVAFSVPTGWTAPLEGYARVINTAFIEVDSWTLAGTTFTSPNTTDYIPSGNGGSFELLYSATPASAETDTFTITVTDDTGVSRTVSTAVTVNPYNTSGLNNTGTGIWHEDVR